MYLRCLSLTLRKYLSSLERSLYESEVSYNEKYCKQLRLTLRIQLFLLRSNISMCVYNETKCFKIENKKKYSVRGKNLDLTYSVLRIYKKFQPMLIKGMEKYLV